MAKSGGFETSEASLKSKVAYQAYMMGETDKDPQKDIEFQSLLADRTDNEKYKHVEEDITRSQLSTKKSGNDYKKEMRKLKGRDLK